MPNSAALETTAGAIARRQSRWDDAVRSAREGRCA